MKKGNILFGSLILASIFFFAACGSGGGSSSSAPSGVVNEYFDCIQSGDYEGMVMLFAGSDSYSVDQIKQNADLMKMGIEAQNKAKGGIDKLSIIEENINDAGDAATVKVKTVFKDGSEEDSEISLAKANGKWKIKL